MAGQINYLKDVKKQEKTTKQNKIFGAEKWESEL